MSPLPWKSKIGQKGNPTLTVWRGLGSLRKEDTPQREIEIGNTSFPSPNGIDKNGRRAYYYSNFQLEGVLETLSTFFLAKYYWPYIRVITYSIWAYWIWDCSKMQLTSKRSYIRWWYKFSAPFLRHVEVLGCVLGNQPLLQKSQKLAQLNIFVTYSE